MWRFLLCCVVMAALVSQACDPTPPTTEPATERTTSQTDAGTTTPDTMTTDNIVAETPDPPEDTPRDTETPDATPDDPPAEAPAEEPSEGTMPDSMSEEQPPESMPEVTPEPMPEPTPEPPPIQRQTIVKRIDPGESFDLSLLPAQGMGTAPYTYDLQQATKDYETTMPDPFRGYLMADTFTWKTKESDRGRYHLTVMRTDSMGQKTEITLHLIVEMLPLKEKKPYADFVNQQYEKGLAAGNRGDYYQNNDNNHARFRFGSWFTQIVEEPGMRGFSNRVYKDKVLIGNASLAYTSGTFWGSLTRKIAMARESSIMRAYEQYRSNNHNLHPEHRDHDAKDEFHCQFDYITISQGSSSSERNDIRWQFLILAALRPDVKHRLIKEGMLMPVMQMIYRRMHVANDAEYMTGKAHPSAFDYKGDDLKIVQYANTITLADLPPMVQLEVQSETYQKAAGRVKTEQFATTPTSICRIFRTDDYTKTITVNAKKSFDINKRKLTFHWKVLRGDPAHVRIKTTGANKDTATIEIDYHPETTIGMSMRKTNRVTVGVFVDNGKFPSSPAFITSFTLANEDRVYKNKKLESKTTNNNYVDPTLK